MPKNLYELLRVFAVFYKSSNQSEPFLESENAEIRIFRPEIWKNENVLRFHFRLYGRVSGSMFRECNENLQFCGGVTYYLNLATGELNREQGLNRLNDVLSPEIDITSYLNSI